MNRTIAVCAMQGAFAEHEAKASLLGCKTIELRQACDVLKSFDALILPGGESTVQSKLLRELNMFDKLKNMIEEGMPVFGTCAGLILLATEIEEPGNSDIGYTPKRAGVTSEGFKTMPVTVLRNAYGRQLGSFHAEGDVQENGWANASSQNISTQKEMPLEFIRAPRITNTSADVEELVTLKNEPVAIRYKNQIGCAFHPELTDDLRLYELLLAL